MLDTATTASPEVAATPAVTPDSAKPEAAAPETKVVVEQKSEREIATEREAKEHEDLRAEQKAILEKIRAEKAAKNGTPAPDKAVEKPATVATGEKTRDEKGKFVASGDKPATDKPAEPVKDAAKPEEKPAEKPVESKKTDLQPPAHWTKEAKAKFATLEPEVQKYLVEDSKRIAQSFTIAGQEKKQLKSIVDSYKPLNDTISKHLDTLKGWGMPAHEAFDGLMATAKRLDTDPAGAIRQLAADYQVNIATLLNDGDLSNLPPDPRLEQASTQIAALERQLAQTQRRLEAEQKERESFFARQRTVAEEREAQQREQTVQQYRSEIDKLASELPHFEELEADIADLLPAVMKKFPNDQVGALKEAHRIALHANPTLSQSLIQKQIEEADAKRRAESERIAQQARTAAKLNAPANASSAPSDPNDVRAAQFAALQKARQKGAAARAI